MGGGGGSGWTCGIVRALSKRSGESQLQLAPNWTSFKMLRDKALRRVHCLSLARMDSSPGFEDAAS